MRQRRRLVREDVAPQIVETRGGAILGYALALCLSKNATIKVGLCETHSAARKRDIAITWFLVLASFASFYLAAAVNEPMFLFVGIVLFLAGVIYGIVKARVVATQKIDDQFVWLTGVNGEYLKQFPQWQGAR